MPTPQDQNAYEILGVARTATQDEVKKRYRELARQLHPDVNPDDPAASKRFSQVTQAYKTLSDPDSRKMFDAEMTLREQRQKQAAARSAPPPHPPANSTATNRPRPATAATGPTESIRMTGEARAAFLRDRPVEARTLAEKAISLNRRNADAWEVLGDVFRRQGRNDDAIQAYSMSLQINPRNNSVMQRLERMARAGGPSGPSRQQDAPPPPDPPRRSMADSIPRSAYSTPRAQYRPPTSGGTYGSASYGSAERLQDPYKRQLRVLLVSVIGYASVFMLVLYAAFYPGIAPINALPLLSWISHWNGTIATILALSGLILGATMTITGAVRRIDDELILTGVNGGGGTFLPLGLLLIVISVLNFYAAAVIYAIVTTLQESFTQSMMRAFGAVLVITVLLSAVYTPDHLQVLLFGGNVVFITFVIGWLLGDFFRPEFS